jgi:hypothetical protein
MPTGRHTCHRAPSITDKARAVAKTVDLASIVQATQAAGITTLALPKRSTSAGADASGAAVVGMRHRLRDC